MKLIEEENLDFINSNSLFAALHSDRYNKERGNNENADPHKLEILKDLIINPGFTVKRKQKDNHSNEDKSSTALPDLVDFNPMKVEKVEKTSVLKKTGLIENLTKIEGNSNSIKKKSTWGACNIIYL